MSATVQHVQGKGLPKTGILKLALDSESAPGKVDPNVLLNADVWGATRQPAALTTLSEAICLPASRTGA